MATRDLIHHNVTISDISMYCMWEQLTHNVFNAKYVDTINPCYMIKCDWPGHGIYDFDMGT